MATGLAILPPLGTNAHFLVCQYGKGNSVSVGTPEQALPIEDHVGWFVEPVNSEQEAIEHPMLATCSMHDSPSATNTRDVAIAMKRKSYQYTA